MWFLPVSGAATRESSERCSGSRVLPARCSAGSSPLTCPGAGFSTSICRSGGWRWRYWRPPCPAAASGGAGHRLGRHRPAGRRAVRHRTVRRSGRHSSAVGLSISRRPRHRERTPARGLPAGGAAGDRAGAPSGAIQQPGVPGRQHGQPDRRTGTVRLRHLPAAFPPGGEGLDSDRIGPGADADDGRHADDLDSIGTADQPPGPLSDLSYSGDGGRDRRAGSALPGGRQQ